jgi:hypothetical protein
VEIRKTAIKHSQLIIAMALIIIAVMLRLLPHEPNFAPVGAIALFGGVLLGWRLALWLPLSVMMLSDLLLGFYPGIQYTWIGFLLVAGFGMLLKKLPFLPRVTLGAFGSAAIFFVVSNFGVWLAGGMYAQSVEGLWQCYYAALPFFRMTLLGDAFYAFMLFGVYELATGWVCSRQLAVTA